ncbi:MAG: N-acetyltransferase family protein [Promethearchaeota archaeon]|jgi:ribosomal protein S18 acetylase RimI-like enzyme
MRIRIQTENDRKELIGLIGRFRIRLAQLKGIDKELDLKGAQEELDYYQQKNFPIFVAEDKKNNLIGYHVCRVEDKIIWSESLYVVPDERRKGIGSALYEKGEILVKEVGGETLYNWVHPNNNLSIQFLKKRGYDVLNLIEIRRKRLNEAFTQEISVGKHRFNY